MTESFTGFTSTDLIAAASKVLLDAGYQQIREELLEWDTPTSRLFEDEYNIVGILVFDTCAELLQMWPDKQGSLVNVISQYVGQGESKAWDGYLILLTSGIAPSECTEIEAVRYDTKRLRKIVATGEDLRTLADVERVLRPLIPLSQEQARLSQESALDLLPDLLVNLSISKETTRIIVEAFREQSPLLERLHQQRAEK